MQVLGHRKLARYTTWNPEPTSPYVGETRRTERGRLFLVTHMRPAWLSQSETELWGKYQEPQWVNRDLRDVANHQGFKPPKPPKQEIDAVEEVWHGLRPPYPELFDWAEGRADQPTVRDVPVFRPFMLAHPLCCL